MTLDNYISHLQALTGDIPKFVEEFIQKHKGGLLSAVKLRFWNKGLDGNLNLIGRYSPGTIKRKKTSPYSRTTFVTLRNTGSWYDNLIVSYEKGTLFLDNNQKQLTQKLIEGDGKYGNPAYGPAIMEFTQQEIDDLVNNLIDDLTQFLNTKLDAQIDIVI
jgi:hypothetical protein